MGFTVAFLEQMCYNSRVPETPAGTVKMVTLYRKMEQCDGQSCYDWRMGTLQRVTPDDGDGGYERSDAVMMFELHSMVARERRNDLLTEAERVRRGAEIYSAERPRFRDGRRAVGQALIRAGQAISNGTR